MFPQALKTFSLTVALLEKVVQPLGGGASGGSESLGMGIEVLFIPQHNLDEKWLLRLTSLSCAFLLVALSEMSWKF